MHPPTRPSPKEQLLNLIWVEKISDVGKAVLRRQINDAIKDPEYAIVTNYGVVWQSIFINQKDSVINLVHGIGATKEDLVDLREQITAASRDTTFPVIVSYPVSWKYVEISKSVSRRIVRSHSDSGIDVQDLEKQVKWALADPCHAVITNYSVTCSEGCVVWTS
jgi:predicted phage-related endonuclease